MLTGKRFTISKTTVALEATNGARSLITVPQGAIVEVTSGSTEGIGTVAVTWEGRTLAMFAVDLQKRGIETAESTGQSTSA